MSPFFQVINKNLYKSLSREDMTSQNVLKKTVTAAVSPTKLIRREYKELILIT